MPAFFQLLEMLRLHLKIIGCLYILAPHRPVRAFSGGTSCDGIQQSRQNRLW